MKSCFLILTGLYYGFFIITLCISDDRVAIYGLVNLAIVSQIGYAIIAHLDKQKEDGK